MSDTYDSDPTALPPLTKAIVAGAATGPSRVGPVASDLMLRALLDYCASIEQRVTALGG